ncbi:hypothetical protein F3Y22_tig00110794pilonHSYRG00085 [Hibiscus syriacus]|uniref:Integrase catalytic domain-containing protein n=1 Tax=Hibiscus syriacus TaxID=106335 RepID=A0A6A2ZQI4_HIBSY|nr:hypothetical protein F3Y22_tig00110794pilonHSYRG00085 [Hibiscus syriacus]
MMNVLLVVTFLSHITWAVKGSSHCKQTDPGEIRPHSVTITEFGAVGDGVTLNTKAFQNAIFYLNSFADKVVDPLTSYGQGRELPGGRHRSLIYGCNLADSIRGCGVLHEKLALCRSLTASVRANYLNTYDIYKHVIAEMEFPAQSSKTFSHKKVNVMLDEMNFLLWKQQVLLTVRSHRLERLLTGAVSTPPETIVDDNDIAQINEEYEEFVAQSLKKGGDSMRTYLTLVKEVCDALVSCGSPVPSVERIASILKGLPREYQSFVAVITTMKDTLNLDSIYTMLLDAEMQLTGFDEQIEALPMSAHIAQGEGRGASFSNSRADSRYNYSNSRGAGRGRGRSRVQCQLCGKVGHLVDRCWHRFNKDFSCVTTENRTNFRGDSYPLSTDTCTCCGKERPRSSGMAQANTVNTAHSSDRWVIDSGATHHVTTEASNVMEPSDFNSPGKLLVGNGMPLNVNLVGRSSVYSSSRILLLNDLLHVPQITKNLLSVSKLTKDNDVFLEFHANRCCVRDEMTGCVLLQGEESSGLYSFAINNDAPVVHVAEVHTASVNGSIDELWHRRLGHPAAPVLANLSSELGFKLKIDVNKACTACYIGKSHKLPFGESNTVYSSPFELVFTDLWGPSHISSNAFRYYVSFVDAFTRHTWLYLLKSKDKAIIAFELFQKLVHRQFGYSIMTVQSDWGGEFRSMSSLLAKQGIVHRLSCPHTSEQNGIVECKHRHIVELALVLLAQAAMPIKYWSYAVVSAVSLINRLPTKVLQGLSPFEKLMHKKPDYKMMKVFGCQCFPYLRPFHNYKLEFRSRACAANDNMCTSNESSILSPSLTIVADPRQSLFHAASPVVHQNENSSTQSANDDLDPVSSQDNMNHTELHSVPDITMPSSDDVPCAPQRTHHMLTRSRCACDEYDALLRNNTWTLTTLPEDQTVVGCKWLFKVKSNSDGSVQRYKARLVAKGFSQIPGYDFKETFSPVIRFSTFNTILAIAVNNGWTLRHIDINNAFLNGDLLEDVYMQQPSGFEEVNEHGKPFVCKLQKALYGLRQAPRNWHVKLKQNLVQMEFMVSRVDPSLFLKRSSQGIIYVLVYVDDIVITGSTLTDVEEVVAMLKDRFSLKDLGELRYFLGIEVKKSGQDVVLSQRKFVKELLEKTGMKNAAGCSTPMIMSTKLSRDEGELINNATEYRSIVGSLLYVCHTRPDIAFSVGQVAQFMNSPRDVHFIAFKCILRYLAATLNFGLVFSPSAESLDVVAFADANWGSNVDDRRSISGFRQSCMPIVWCDNTSTVAMSANLVYHAQSKHVELDIHFVREKVTAGQLCVNYVPAMHQAADGLTKPLSKAMFEEFKTKMLNSFLFNTELLHAGDNGTIDGQGIVWWNWFRSKTLNSTRPHLVDLMNSSGVVISNLNFLNSPFWTIHPVYCSRVTVQNVTILAPLNSTNTDGIDPVGGICTEFHLLAPAQIFSSAGSLVIIETALGLQLEVRCPEVFLKFMQETSIFFDSSTAIIIKTAPGMGGYVRNIYISDVTLACVDTAIRFNSDFSEHPDEFYDPNALPVIERITVKDVK